MMIITFGKWLCKLYNYMRTDPLLRRYIYLSTHTTIYSRDAVVGRSRSVGFVIRDDDARRALGQEVESDGTAVWHNPENKTGKLEWTRVGKWLRFRRWTRVSYSSWCAGARGGYYNRGGRTDYYMRLYTIHLYIRA